MAVLESAVREALGGNLPAPSQRGQSVGGGPAFFFQQVQGKRAVGAGAHVGQFLDPEVFRLLLELHGGKGEGKKARPREKEPKTVAQSVLNPVRSLGLISHERLAPLWYCL